MNKLTRKLWQRAIILALLPAALWSCEEPETPVPDVKFTLNPAEVTLPAEGGQATFSLDAPVAWKASAQDSWITIDPSQGDAAKVTVTLKASANETGESRSTTVTVSATELSLSASVKVTQPSKELPPQPTPSITVNPTTTKVPAAGSTFTVKVSANVDWTAKADCDWITLRPANGASGDTDVTIVVAANTEEKEKSGKVTFSGSNTSATLIVNIEPFVPEAPEEIPGITCGLTDWVGAGNTNFEAVDGGEAGTESSYYLYVLDYTQYDPSSSQMPYELYPMTEAAEGVFSVVYAHIPTHLLLVIDMVNQLQYGIPVPYYPTLNSQELTLPASPTDSSYYMGFMNEGQLQVVFVPGERVIKVKLL